ncbi:alpha/beta fold hydrolase [Nocardia sp. NPDC059764]|uniref:alpha/beta fold hydrolase n=1 Tax=Nocardia sp. NPDC059764 TaxID=3346939 RepID=UPI0036679252
MSPDHGAPEQDRFATTAAGVDICYRESGDPDGEPLLLIAGLGLDLTSWPAGMVDGFAERGFRVIRLDNRDVGRSTHIDTRPPTRAALTIRAAPARNYDLTDMARDTVGLLDHLAISRVHLVGMSMGGMIAQTVAAWNPTRVTSLTSIFSTTGSLRVGQLAPSTMLRLLKRPPRTRAESVEQHLALVRHIGSPEFPLDPAVERSYAAGAWDRGDGARAHHGVSRQMGAIVKSGDRTPELRRITAPTLVIHGDVDRMVHPSGGRATAAAVPYSRHVTVAGMRHHLAPGLADRLVAHAADHAATASG